MVNIWVGHGSPGNLALTYIETLAKSFNADQLVAGQKKGSILERTASTD